MGSNLSPLWSPQLGQLNKVSYVIISNSPGFLLRGKEIVSHSKAFLFILELDSLRNLEVQDMTCSGI